MAALKRNARTNRNSILMLHTKNKGGERTHCDQIVSGLGHQYEFIRYETALTITSLFMCNRLIHENQIKLIHAHGFKALLFAKIIATFCKHCPPILITVHGAHVTRKTNPIARRLHTYIARWHNQSISEWITISPSDTIALKQAGIIQHSQLIPNGVSITPTHAPLPEHIATILTKKDHIKIATIGALEPIKNPEYIIKLAHKIKQQPMQKPIEFILIGSGPMLNPLKATCKKLNLDNIHFLGQQPNVTSILTQCNRLIHYSSHEGLPYSILEAMALKCPVIASDVPGNHDIVHHNKTGWLCAPQNLDALYNTVQDSLNTSESELHKITTAAFNEIKNHYAIDTQLKALSAIYEQLISPAKSPVTHPLD
ncbi:MAG: glycosyltransferase [bacterium]|nr:glycosyltransferase [bacterium]